MKSERHGRDFPRGKSALRSKAAGTLLLIAVGAAAWQAEATITSRLLRLPWRANLSPSLPKGLYRIVRQPLRQDTLVAVCLPPNQARMALHKGYLEAGSCPGGAQPILKRALALPGDRFQFTPAGFVRSGKLLAGTAPRPRDRAGRPVPHLAFGAYTVRPGEIWLYSESPFGWDSRYWGAVPISSVREALHPLWTWRAE